MADKPTRERAVAFVGTQAPTAFCDGVGDVLVRSDSRTHLEAVLGQGNIPTVGELERLASDYAAVVRKYRDSAAGSADHRIWANDNAELDAIEAKRDNFLDLIQGYIDALRPEGYGTCATCGNWAERTGEHAPDGFRGDWSACSRLVEAHVMDTGRLRAVPTAPTFSCPLWCAKGGDSR